MREEKLKFEENRCIYENEDILVMHSIGHFPDGTKEAIMAVHTLSNGKIVKTESGATRIDKLRPKACSFYSLASISQKLILLHPYQQFCLDVFLLYLTWWIQH